MRSLIRAIEGYKRPINTNNTAWNLEFIGQRLRCEAGGKEGIEE